MDITIHDIARKLNISASTVSRAINGSSLVNKRTRERILAVAREMGYSPNTMAANLRNRRTNTLGVIVPWINRHFFSSVISGIEDAACEFGYTVNIAQSKDDSEKEKQIAHQFFTNRVDGLIVSYGMHTQNFDHFKTFTERGTPLVCFDRVSEELPSHKISINDFESSYGAVMHLISQGAKRIAHIGGSLNLNIYRDRLAGYKKAIEDGNVVVDEKLVAHNSLTRRDGEVAIQEMLASGSVPDAVFCANDTTALSVLLYLENIGIRVPDEIKIVGFSDEPFSEVTNPSITTVRQPGYMMGEKAGRLIIEEIKGKNEVLQYQNIVLPGELVIRESSRKKA